MLRQKADFPMKPGMPAAAELKKAEMPSLSDFIYPVLLDIDPAQEVDDEYKNCHNQLFAWRMLRLISQIDVGTFQKEKSCQGSGADKGSNV